MTNNTKKKNNNAAKPAAAVNPMKDGPEEDEKIAFETEEVAGYAADVAEEYGLDLGEMVGTGPDGVITADDVEKAITAADNLDDPDAENDNDTETDPADEETVNFASDVAGEFYAENEEKINIDEVKGTGKDGAITKGDLKNAMPADPEPSEDADQAEEEVDEIKSIIDDLVSFGLPVRGALKNKPLVLERWLDLQARAVKAQRAF